MSDCLNGGQKDGFTTLEMGGEPHKSSAPVTTAPAKSRLGAGACLWIGLTTVIAIVSLILGSWATHEALQLRDKADRVGTLVSSPRDVPAGYTMFALGTGLGYWSLTTPMMHPRSDHGVLSTANSAYLVGGLTPDPTTENGVVLSSIVRYDMNTGLSEELPRMEANGVELPRQRFAYAMLDSKIYVMGGADSSSYDALPLNTVLVYDTVAKTWTLTEPLNVPRFDACGAAANGKVYVFGGYNEIYHSLGSVEEYDPATGKWTLLPESSNLIEDRGDCRAAEVNGLIYAVGGTEYIGPATGDCAPLWTCYKFLDSVEAFDPATKRWSRRASMNFARGDFGIEVIPGGRIIVAGGERGNGTQTELAMFDVEEYIVEDNVWVQKGPLPEARFRSDMAYYNGRVFAFGGVPSCNLLQNEFGNATATNATCYALALDTVFAYYDIQAPRLYAYFKPAPVNSTN